MKGEGKEAHLFPLNGVFSRGLGLTLPLHVVSEHDDLRLDRGHAHWVNVWQRENGKQLRERKQDTWNLRASIHSKGVQKSVSYNQKASHCLNNHVIRLLKRP